MSGLFVACSGGSENAEVRAITDEEFFTGSKTLSFEGWGSNPVIITGEHTQSYIGSDEMTYVDGQIYRFIPASAAYVNDAGVTVPAVAQSTATFTFDLPSSEIRDHNFKKALGLGGARSVFFGVEGVDVSINYDNRTMQLIGRYSYTTPGVDVNQIGFNIIFYDLGVNNQ